MSKPSPPVEIKIYDRQQLVFTTKFHGCLEIGRRQSGEPRPFTYSNSEIPNRIIIADLEDNTVSRRQAKFEQLDDGRLNITNLSSAMAIGLSDGGSIGLGERMNSGLEWPK